jgi:hypothetical protein
LHLLLLHLLHLLLLLHLLPLHLLLLHLLHLLPLHLLLLHLLHLLPLHLLLLHLLHLLPLRLLLLHLLHLLPLQLLLLHLLLLHLLLLHLLLLHLGGCAGVPHAGNRRQQCECRGHLVVHVVVVVIVAELVIGRERRVLRQVCGTQVAVQFRLELLRRHVNLSCTLPSPPDIRHSHQCRARIYNSWPWYWARYRH